MITIIARWEVSQVEPELEHRMWRQLKGAFAEDQPAAFRMIFVPKLHDHASVEQYDTVEEALAAAGDADRVFLEPSANMQTVADIPEGDIIMVLGNTESGNSHIADDTEMYAIAYPGTADLYGINAAAIALAVRFGQ